MINKRGFLLAEETLKIIIAVICLGFLTYLLGSLYFSNQNDKDLKLAEASLQYLVDEVDLGRESVEIYNPVSFKKWFIISWPKDEIVPNSCSNLGWENCICICKNGGGSLIGLSISPEGMKEDCDSLGTCLEYNKRIIVEDDVEQSPINIVDPPLKLNIEYGDEIIITK